MITKWLDHNVTMNSSKVEKLNCVLTKSNKVTDLVQSNVILVLWFDCVSLQ